MKPLNLNPEIKGDEVQTYIRAVIPAAISPPDRSVSGCDFEVLGGYMSAPAELWLMLIVSSGLTFS